MYRLIDPEQYRNSKVLVVGGGDSALEAAVSIAEIAGTKVSLSYRSSTFSRARQKNRQKIADMQQNHTMNVLMKSNVREIYDGKVEIEQDGELIELENDAIIVCAGGILPTPFLKETGIQVDTKYGTQ